MAFCTVLGFRGPFLGALCSLILFSSCESPPTATRPPVLTVFQSSVSIGDPHIASDSADRLGILFSIYEALVKLDEEGRYQPSLAERWEVGKDAGTWTASVQR